MFNWCLFVPDGVDDELMLALAEVHVLAARIRLPHLHALHEEGDGGPGVLHLHVEHMLLPLHHVHKLVHPLDELVGVLQKEVV